MIKLIIIQVGLLLTAAQMNACICSIPTYEEHDYIALVKVIQVNCVEDSFGYDIDFETLEQFKGDRLSNMTIVGQHEYDMRMSSCSGPQIKQDEIWILSARIINGKLTAGFCTRTMKVRNVNGERTMPFAYHRNHIILGRSINLDTSDVTTGKHILYYENGQIEAELSFKNDLAHGEWFTYYKSGEIMSYQCFDEGVPHEQKYRKYNDGKLRDLCLINKGRLTNCKFYNNNKVLREFNYDNNGKVIERKNM